MPVKYKLKKWKTIPKVVFQRYKNRNNQQRIDRILSLIPKKASCLEVGCGLGYQAGVIIKEKLPAHYAGFDIADLYINSCNDMIRVNGFNVGKFYIDDITKLNDSISRSEYSVILCTEVLEHIPNYKEAILGLHKLCISNAKVIFTVPRYGKMTKVAGHVNNFKKEELKSLFEGFGLRVKHHEYVSKLYSLFVLTRKSA